MQYVQFKTLMGEFTVFSLADIRQAAPMFDRRRLNEWQDKGYIKKVIKGYYIFTDLPMDEKVLFEIANRIYTPSYVSFEMALAYHEMIPECIYGVTSVSTRKTMHFKTHLCEFSYRSIRPTLYFGYEYVPVSGKYCKIASPEKALLDYIYLHNELNNVDDFAQMRINRDVFFEKVDRNKLESYAVEYGHKSFNKRLKTFLEYLAHV